MVTDTNVNHVVGPPGTGKTTYLAAQAKDAVLKYGGKNVLICSLTRAAAFEIGGRDTEVAPENVGTLHAHAYRALGKPVIAESKVKDWNAAYPEYEITSGRKGGVDDPMDEESGQGDGDALLAEINNLRAALVPEEKWRLIHKDFWMKWSGWKDENGYMDFTDLIEKCLTDTSGPPGDPMVMIGDEAQDWSAMEAKLFRDHWGSHANEVIMAGDGDQTLYSWRGADPNIFLDHPVPADQHRVLEQSWRVPGAVHEVAQRWIRQIHHREDVKYRPTPNPGEFGMFDGSFKNLDALIDDIKAKITDGESCMVLASCGFLLKPIISVLRAEGIPFHNPYRKQQPVWNPLQRRKDAVIAADRLLAYLAPTVHSGRDAVMQWTEDEFETWVPLLRTGDVLRRGVKNQMGGKGEFKFMPNMTLGSYQHYFEDFESHHELTMSCDLDWFEGALLPSKVKPMEYPLNIARAFGHESLSERPRVVVGTIHSVKGGEADNVYVFPDLSPAAMREWGDAGEGHDAIIRMFYVAMTRSKNRLYLCNRGSNFAVDWN